MKRTFKFFLSAAAVILSFASCEDPEPEYVESEAIVLDQVKETSATMMTETDFILNTIFSGNGYTLNLSICNKGLGLETGVYELKSELAAIGDCTVSMNDGRSDIEFSSGSVVVRDADGGYSVEFRLAGKSSYTFSYEGPLSYPFDVTPSSNTFFVMEGDVTTMNDQWQTVIVGGVTKYSVFLVNPEGKDVARIELIGKSGLTLPELAGTYTIGSSIAAGTAVVGALSWWGPATGSYFIDSSNTAQYISGGKLTFSTIKGSDGKDYYSITGSGLSLVSENNVKGKGDLTHLFVKEKLLLGRVERNHVIESKYKNREMKYSIYLPEGYDGLPASNL